jgi:hypothetical protein
MAQKEPNPKPTGKRPPPPPAPPPIRVVRYDFDWVYKVMEVINGITNKLRS